MSESLKETNYSIFFSTARTFTECAESHKILYHEKEVQTTLLYSDHTIISLFHGEFQKLRCRYHLPLILYKTGYCAAKSMWFKGKIE